MGRPKKYTDKERARIQKEYNLKYYWANVGAQRKAAREVRRHAVVAERCPGFELIKYYPGAAKTNARVDLKCKTCGTVINRSWCSVKQSRVACDNCKTIKAAERERKQASADYKEQLHKEITKERGFEQVAFSICECCGRAFLPSKRGLRYCSRECRERVHNAVKKDRRIRRMTRSGFDKITLERLFERDGGVCYLCGNPCLWTDGEQRGDTFIAGDYYPSIDHVIPLSCGGPHTWDNVRLAHRICNTTKGAIYPPWVKMDEKALRTGDARAI